ncbi:MAG: DUF2397 family protein [Lentisphaerae bacterium]|nr:DUF2397 family protein [Lentisphaerota bacterium]MBT4822829.1 DUF2397 family protein [Lentisphaerota bacterium]MBT5605614.1 DUF2397 family protein [Lentisphaerota bacterium]MBT7053800.1 DUF2397 family protein [Lentisphaerota bacterium]MBT7847179.1 DUF2397 family protein [Lentisphaerota bacterium]
MPEEPNPKVNPAELFGSQSLEAFSQGAATALIERRNSHLGSLVLAERGAFYVQILYRLLLFRRTHELEPLYEDVYDAVREPQSLLCEDGDYSPDQFRTDLDQLQAWELVSCRIERERLRGYRDTRKRKFRYRLGEDAVAFLEWLEERLQEELEGRPSDTRDLLEEVCGNLTTLLRLLRRFGSKRERGDDARRILFQLFRLDTLSLDINGELGAFNARLLGFVVHHYDVGEAKGVLVELDRFVNEFLRQINELRNEIVEFVEQLLDEKNQAKLRSAIQIMEEERRKAPGLLKRSHEASAQERIPRRLRAFYRETGHLDRLCRRIQDASIQVWRKLHSHLRELERKSNRLEDLREAIRRLADQPVESCPSALINRLVSPAIMRHDPRFWDDHEKADPPQPRRRPVHRPGVERRFLPRKRRGTEPVVSMERARLERLKRWLEVTVGLPYEGTPQRVSQGAYTDPEDFARIMDLARAGILGEGRKLKSVSYRVEATPEYPASVVIDDQQLSFDEMLLSRSDDES